MVQELYCAYIKLHFIYLISLIYEEKPRKRERLILITVQYYVRNNRQMYQAVANHREESA